jgi:hypothetical protein
MCPWLFICNNRLKRLWECRKGVKKMKITAFAVKLAKLEKGKIEVNIAQIMELLNKINVLTKGVLYKVIGLL